MTLIERENTKMQSMVEGKIPYRDPKSTLSDILSAKYVYLDDLDLNKHQAIVKKNRKQAWATLEAALIEWQIWYDRHPDSGSTTGDLLRYKATEIWGKLLEYTGLECPTWLGWLTGFKKRYTIKERRRYNEAADAQIDEDSERIIEEIRQDCRKYTADCMYPLNTGSAF